MALAIKKVTMTLRNILLIMDSTGLKFLCEGEWKRKQYGSKYRREWWKLHIAIDAEPFKYVQYNLPQTMSATHRYSMIYLIRFHL